VRGSYKLLNLVNSIRKIALTIVLLVCLATGTLLIYDLLIQTSVNLPNFVNTLIRITLIAGFWLTILIVIIRSKHALAKHLGYQPATIIQFFMGSISIIIIIFAILHIIGVSPDSLLTGAGIVTITIGLVVSTFVGSLLSGAFVITSHKVRVDDNVIVNNTSGKIIEITAIVTRVRNDVGVVTIPNSAIASGSVIITKIQAHENAKYNRLPYEQGDRIFTTYMQGEGTVTELTSLQTKVLLDSGKELTFLNSSILSGSIAVAKIHPKNGTHKDSEGAI